MVHIVSLEGQSDEERRAERKRMKAATLATVAAAPGWSLFRDICEQNAHAIEQSLLSPGNVQDVRVMDRAIGKAAAYREIPKLVEKAARDYVLAAQQAAANNQEQGT